MEICNFDKFRAGGKWPGCLDIEKINYHSEVGVMAVASYFNLQNNKSFVQFRKHNKDPRVAIFSFNHEVELEEYWQNSTVIWDSRLESI